MWAEDVATESGKDDLAQELLESAIERGHVRCVYVRSASEIASRHEVVLEAIDPAQFADGVSLEWDYGLEAHAESPDHPYSVTFSGFVFLWDEIAAMRPRQARELEEEEKQETRLRSSAITSQLSAVKSADPHRVSQIVRLAPASNGSRRGRRPRQHGAPIAAFLARAVREGAQIAAREKDEELGRWLLAEYEAAGDRSPPDLRNAASDARGALNAWISAMAQLPSEN
ncbi:hypothetical protein EWE75_23700 [Sphingomonas populi]|uniref:Uncharacterized protein n=1 Tax=Sphingomonas populi TaxID=2484750 RepID=A0A4Q6XIL5_9SPHN|nr:hypothetical protein [Sphingomonas populi]RZF59075.1 hypothetical protein EWE75_23700 [Sphingomonas populi]